MNKHSPSNVANARASLSQQLNQKLPAVVAEMDRLEARINQLQAEGITGYGEIMNLCLYTTIAYADMMVLTGKILITGDDQTYERDLYARMLAVTMAEYGEDMTKLLGNKFRDELQQHALDGFLERFSVINKSIHDFDKANGAMLRAIRNNAFAHRSLDAAVQLKYTFTDTENIMELGLKAIELNAALTPLTTDVLRAVNERLG